MSVYPYMSDFHRNTYTEYGTNQLDILDKHTYQDTQYEYEPILVSQSMVVVYNTQGKWNKICASEYIGLAVLFNIMNWNSTLGVQDDLSSQHHILLGQHMCRVCDVAVLRLHTQNMGGRDLVRRWTYGKLHETRHTGVAR